jgi:hypothetical protein
VGGLTLSVNAFSPKPWTPFQWEPMETIPVLREKLSGLKKRLARLPRVTVDTESPREAYYQTLLSRGDRRTSQILLETHHNGGDWWSVVQRLRRAAKSSKFQVPNLKNPLILIFSCIANTIAERFCRGTSSIIP